VSSHFSLVVLIVPVPKGGMSAALPLALVHDMSSSMPRTTLLI
jgi:hypothetical protein